jgi:hypothetical protein
MSKNIYIINKNTIKKDKEYRFSWIHLYANFKTQLIIEI